MTPGEIAPESHRNVDDLRKLYDELQEDIIIRKYMITNDAAKFLDEISQSIQGQPTQDSTGDWKLALQNTQLKKDMAMVS